MEPCLLIERIIPIVTNPGSLVLDSFLGSGTTAAVTHKIGRRYIGIEMGINQTSRDEGKPKSRPNRRQ